jgi:hypothetical protein
VRLLYIALSYWWTRNLTVDDFYSWVSLFNSSSTDMDISQSQVLRPKECGKYDQPLDTQTLLFVHRVEHWKMQCLTGKGYEIVFCTPK